MSMIIQQGNFLSTGADKVISLRGGVDWMRVYNSSVYQDNAVTTKQGVEWYWQFGLVANGSLVTFKSNAANAGNLTQYVDNTFFPFDSSANPVGAAVALTAISNANPPVVSSAGSNLAEGSVVRIINVAGAQQFGGMDFTIGYNTLTANTFSLDYAPQIVAGTNGHFRLIKYGPLFNPSRRSITNITRAANAVVKLSVTHDYKVGQQVRMVVPAIFGMIEMNGLQATIVAVDYTVTTGNTITLDIDSSAFTAFGFPLTADVPFTPAEVIPFGEDTGISLLVNNNILDDAVVNSGIIGMRLAGGASDLPAGQTNDEIFWIAGTSYKIDNEF